MLLKSSLMRRAFGRDSATSLRMRLYEQGYGDLAETTTPHNQDLGTGRRTFTPLWRYLFYVEEHSWYM